MDDGRAVQKPERFWRRRGERFFVWRGEDVSRIENLSDAVFALTLTLLFLDTATRSGVEGMISLLKAGPDYVAFALTFLVLVMIWNGHFLFFRRYGLRDGYSRTLNYALLLLVLCFAYPLKYLFRSLVGGLFGERWQLPDLGYDPGPILMTVYSGTFGLIYVVFVLLYRHAWSVRDELELDDFERHMTRVYHGLNAIMVAFAATSILLAWTLHSTAMSGWVYCGIGPATGIYGFVMGRRGDEILKATGRV